MNITILGGAGFVGFNLASHFASNNKVTVIDNLVRRGSEINISKFKKLGINFIHGDVRNKEDLNSLTKADIILDCAAQPAATNYENPEFDITNNTHSVLNVMEIARKHKIPVIFWSTNKCYSGKLCNSVPFDETSKRYIWNNSAHYLPGWSMNGFNESLTPNGNDHSIYGISKIMSDLLIQEYTDSFKIPAIINRFSCLAGPNQWGKTEQGWVTWFAIANILQLPIELYGWKGKQVRDCLFINDLISLIEKQIQHLTSGNNTCFGEIYNVGGGSYITTSLLEAIDLLESKTNKKFTNIKIIDTPRRADQVLYISDISKVSAKFNWKPNTSMSVGYDDILYWIDKNRNDIENLYGL